MLSEQAPTGAGAGHHRQGDALMVDRHDGVVANPDAGRVGPRSLTMAA